ncbi:MAG: uroporphyrinogen decarboxylase, partial [Polyangiaceae bacterium]|nr:uroporphyrinogen decarboxylase [Polyangiaceae bacterium]
PSDGPIVAPVRCDSDVNQLRVIDPCECLDYVFTTIRMLRQELKVPLIGFADAPFTLASYLIEGGKSVNFARTKQMMLGSPGTWHLLMGKLSDVVCRHLLSQIDAGVQAIQLFDSWMGQLGVDDYAEFVLPYSKSIISCIKETGVPVIHFGVGTSSLLEKMAEADSTVVGLDWRIPLDIGWSRIGFDRAVQGNLDPATLLAPREIIHSRAARILDLAQARRGHIFNLGHGVLPETNAAEVHALVDFVHEYSSR